MSDRDPLQQPRPHDTAHAAVAAVAAVASAAVAAESPAAHTPAAAPAAAARAVSPSPRQPLLRLKPRVSRAHFACMMTKSKGAGDGTCEARERPNKPQHAQHAVLRPCQRRARRGLTSDTMHDFVVRIVHLLS